MALQVITKTTSDPIIAFAQPMSFTFDLDAGEAILAYVVSLSGFSLRYATDSSHASEQVAQLAVRVVPNLIGDTVFVTPQMLINDGGGSATSEDQDVSDRESTATVSVAAWIGTSPPSYDDLRMLLVPNQAGPSQQTIAIGGGSTYHPFIAGFAASFEEEQRKINQLEVTASASSNDGTAITLTGDTDLEGSKTAPYALTDIGFVVFSSTMSGLALVDASIDLGDPDDKDGITGTLTASVTIPSGFSEIAAALPLIDSFSMSYKNDDTNYVGEIAAGITGGPGFPGGSTFPQTATTLTWDVLLNLWNDRMSNQYIDSGSMTAKVLVQFA